MWKGFHQEQEVLALLAGWRSLIALHSMGKLQREKLGIPQVEFGFLTEFLSQGLPTPLCQGDGKKLLSPE